MTKIKSLIAYTFSHFCVDFACFFVAFRYVFSGFDSYTCGLFFFAYNILAFGLQGIIGYFCDNKPTFPAGMVGCGMVFASLLLGFFPPLAIFVAGVGNAFFHVGGGIDSLKNAEGKMARSGVFVSAGALGVTLGTIYGMGDFSVVLPVFLLLVSLVVIFVFAESKSAKLADIKSFSGFQKFNIGNNTSFEVGIILACVAIFIRCFGGYEIPLSWYDSGVLRLAFCYGLASVFGKAVGGFLGDKYGGGKAGVTLLVLSAPFLMLGDSNMWVSLVGIVLFNTSMPITLCMIYTKLHKNAGLAFGISTLALLFGTFPSVFGLAAKVDSGVVLPIAILCSALCLYFGTRQNSKWK